MRGSTVAEHTHEDGSRCDVAHGDASPPPADDRALLVVYASPLGSYLLRWGPELGFATELLEPDSQRMTPDLRAAAGVVSHDPADIEMSRHTDVVVTDHHRLDLGRVMAPLVRAEPRWIGIIGSPRHAGPHIAALEAEGVDDALIATVRRPIGLDIGSRTPAEIALSVLAGLLAERSGRAGGPPVTAALR